MTAGPWIEPPIIEATISFDYFGTYSGDYNVEGVDLARLRPGIEFLGIGERAMDDDQTTRPASETPNPATSELVWDRMLGSGELLGGIPRDVDGGDQWFAFVDYHGTHYWEPAQAGYPDGLYVQYDRWGYNVGTFRMGQEPRTPRYYPLEWPSGAIGIEFEESEPADILSARLTPLVTEDGRFGLGSADSPWWSMFIKPPTISDPSASLGTSNTRTLEQVLGLPNVTEAGYQFTADDLAVLQSMMAKQGGTETAESDPRWTELAIAYTGPWPGSLAGVQAWPINDWTYRCQPLLALFLSYRVSRYRFIYDTVPYRRIFPRPDGLAGGAPRVYPRGGTQQASNRIVGGIF